MNELVHKNITCQEPLKIGSDKQNTRRADIIVGTGRITKLSRNSHHTRSSAQKGKFHPESVFKYFVVIMNKRQAISLNRKTI